MKSENEKQMHSPVWSGSLQWEGWCHKFFHHHPPSLHFFSLEAMQRKIYFFKKGGTVWIYMPKKNKPSTKKVSLIFTQSTVGVVDHFGVRWHNSHNKQTIILKRFSCVHNVQYAMPIHSHVLDIMCAINFCSSCSVSYVTILIATRLCFFHCKPLTSSKKSGQAHSRLHIEPFWPKIWI